MNGQNVIMHIDNKISGGLLTYICTILKNANMSPMMEHGTSVQNTLNVNILTL